MNESQKEEVINLITNTWDFCGSAMDAVRQWEKDNNVDMAESECSPLFHEAGRRWGKSLT